MKKLFELLYDFYHSPKTFLIAFLITGYIANQLMHYFYSMDPYSVVGFLLILPFSFYHIIYFPYFIFKDNMERYIIPKFKKISFSKGKFGSLIVKGSWMGILYWLYLFAILIYADYSTSIY